MRVALGGKGFPRIEFALQGTDEQISPEVPIVLLLENGEVFHPEDYASLGFTHFDAWCVGATGGYGGGSRSLASFKVTETYEVMSAAQWDMHVEARYLEQQLQDYFALRPPVTTGPGWQPANYDTIRANLEARNPSHSFKIRTYYNPELVQGSGGIYSPERGVVIYDIGSGGAPGGGGLQIVSGELADLPADNDVVVGQVGANGAPGQIRVNGLWYPDPVLIYWTTSYRGSGHPDVWGWLIDNDQLGNAPRRKEIIDALIPWLVRYPSPVGFPTPQSAQNGGYSAFGDVAKASGGKGGRAAYVWDGSKFVEDADGGAGGVGNSIVAGGGGAEGTEIGASGKDGLWNPATQIGQGGGAGNRFGQGGRGSWSYANTTLYGAVSGPAGGGAKIMRKYLHGSKTSKYDPNGAVVLRIYRVG